MRNRKRNRRGRFTRRNPIVLGNPRRRRHSSHKRRVRRHRRNPIVLGNPRRRSHRRSGYRRNPAIIAKLGLPPVQDVLFLGLGAFAGRILVPNVLARVPILSSNPIVRAISRLGIIAAAGYAAKIVLKGNARMFTYGILANQAPEIVNDVLSLTGMKLSDGNDELSLYTAQSFQPAAPGLSMYTLSDGDDGSMGL